MRKLLALAGVTAVALVAPATVGAATKVYEGTVTPGGTVKFKLKTTENGKKVAGFRFSGVPAVCTSGAETVSGRITFADRVENNRFQFRAVAGNPQNPQAAAIVKGEISRNSAEGTIRVHGRKVLVDPPANGQRSECETGTLDWTAEKV
jgi:hypothetical protein